MSWVKVEAQSWIGRASSDRVSRLERRDQRVRGTALLREVLLRGEYLRGDGLKRLLSCKVTTDEPLRIFLIQRCR